MVLPQPAMPHISCRQSGVQKNIKTLDKYKIKAKLQIFGIRYGLYQKSSSLDESNLIGEFKCFRIKDIKTHHVSTHPDNMNKDPELSNEHAPNLSN